MWTHVKHIKFDYSINTTIINAALDYENKLTRKLNSIKKNKLFERQQQQQLSNENSLDETTEDDVGAELTRSMYIERQLVSALELINYSQTCQKFFNLYANNNSPMVGFRCARCAFETIDLSLLRIHKREHLMPPS